ncbi:uncharacterized protein LOC100907559 [Galendromus occidentalis]|uniref:CCR4-NOT transcription complex subunit 9 n=1 Tax=Galendromus occidentalis TaxID=34638 RepID=A0AAJ6QR78_9ACAR|nr:uncharacterized protein LOC100907559 [Galendromus occidentalis]
MTQKSGIDNRPRLLQEWEAMCRGASVVTPSDQNRNPGDTNTLIIKLANPGTREYAMKSLCMFHRNVPDLGVLIWHSFGAVSSLIQEIISAYLRREVLESDAARILTALSLLEAVAEHPRTKVDFVCSKIHEIVAPLANLGPSSPHFEALRRGALRVMRALVGGSNLDRGMIGQKEYACVIMQMLADDFLMKIIWNSVNHGGTLAQLLTLQIIYRVSYYDDVLIIFTRAPNTMKLLPKALEKLHEVCRKEMPPMCPQVVSLYQKLYSRYHQSAMAP